MSEQPKHSPAPWFWDDKDAMPWTDYDAAESAPFLLNANGCPIMTGSDIRIAYEADGRLIAAAPELLEALKALTSNPHVDLGGLVYQVRESEGEGWDGPQVTNWSNAVQSAIAAIAKAEGRGE
jgi:hypothetical protein